MQRLVLVVCLRVLYINMSKCVVYAVARLFDKKNVHSANELKFTTYIAK